MAHAAVVAFVSTDDTMRRRRARKDRIRDILAGSKHIIDERRLKTNRMYPAFSIDFDEPLHGEGLEEDDVATLVRSWVFTEYGGRIRYQDYLRNSVGRWSIRLAIV